MSREPDPYLQDDRPEDDPPTDEDVLLVAVRHSTRVAVAWSGRSASSVRDLRSRNGQNRGRGRPSAEDLEQEAPRLTCDCRMCVVLRQPEVRLSAMRYWRRSVAPPPPGPWKDQAICSGQLNVFFPKRGHGDADPAEIHQARIRGMVYYRPEVYARAKAICARCPVQEDCLDYALTNRIRIGVWGGTDWLDRDRLLGLIPHDTDGTFTYDDPGAPGTLEEATA